MPQLHQLKTNSIGLFHVKRTLHVKKRRPEESRRHTIILNPSGRSPVSSVVKSLNTLDEKIDILKSIPITLLRWNLFVKFLFVKRILHKCQ